MNEKVKFYREDRVTWPHPRGGVCQGIVLGRVKACAYTRAYGPHHMVLPMNPGEAAPESLPAADAGIGVMVCTAQMTMLEPAKDPERPCPPAVAWTVDWFICQADADDVKHDPAKCLGDEMWRVPKNIGPFRVEHNHWASWHLAHDGDHAQTMYDLGNACAAPVMREALEKIQAWLRTADSAGPDFMSGIPLMEQYINRAIKATQLT